jgi:cytochrome c
MGAHMKVAALAALPLLLALAACGGGTETTTSDTGGQAATPEPVAAVAKSGEDLFKKCAACHSVTPDGRNGIGPGLHGVSGRAVASVEGFTYSNGLKAKGGVWDEANLDAFIAAPAKWAPGTKMMFAGISDPAERKALVDYLATLK